MRLREFSVLDRIILLFVGGMLLMSFQATRFRLSGAHYFQAEYFDHVFLSCLVLAVLSALFAMRAQLIEVPFVTLMLVFCVYISSVGLFNLNDNPLGGVRYYVLPIFAYLLLLGRKYILFFYTSKSFWLLMTGTHIIGLLYYFTTLFGTVYPGIGVPSIAYAAIFFFCNSHFVLFAVAVLFIFLEGKRSIILSLLLTLFFLRIIRYHFGLQLLYFIGVAFAAMVVLSTALMYLAGIEGSTTITRINYLNPYSDSYDLFLGSSGRLGELQSFLVGRSMTDLIVGSGAGFLYEWNLGYASEQGGVVKGYFHTSAANYLATGGVFGILVFVSIALMPFRARQLRVSLSAQSTAFGLGLFSVFQSFFGFSLATDIATWLFILGPAMLLGHKALNTCIRRNQTCVEADSQKKAF